MTMVVSRIEFRGQEIEAFEKDGRVWIVLKRVCENLGITARPQRRKIQDNPAFEERWDHMILPSNGGSQEVFCVDLDALSLWLGSISASKVKKSVRDTLIAYQRECMTVLREHFFGPTDSLTCSPIRHLERRLQAVEEVVNEIVTVQSEAKEEVLRLPGPVNMPTSRNMRSLLVERMRTVAVIQSLPFQDVWNTLYREFQYREHVDLKARARNKGVKPLDVAEELGIMDRLYDLCCFLWAIEDWQLPALDPDQREDAKPVPITEQEVDLPASLLLWKIARVILGKPHGNKLSVADLAAELEREESWMRGAVDVFIACSQMVTLPDGRVALSNKAIRLILQDGLKRLPSE